MIILNLQTPDPISAPVHESLPLPGQNSTPISEPAASSRAEPVFFRSPLQAEIPDVAYIRASQRLQMNEIPLALAELEQVLREETVGVYDYTKVKAYLDEQCRELEKQREPGDFRSYQWRWRPIRQYWNVYDWFPNQSSEVYSKPIPAEIFPTIERILNRFPDALFYVSDIRQFQDPFLAVTVKGADKLYVMERWDEPGFRS